MRGIHNPRKLRRLSAIIGESVIKATAQRDDHWQTVWSDTGRYYHVKPQTGEWHEHEPPDIPEYERKEIQALLHR